MEKDNKKEKESIFIKIPHFLAIGIILIFISSFFLLDHFNLVKDIEKNFGQVGDIFAGLFTSIAFIYLISGYFQTNNSIKMHQEELKLQRDEMQNQLKIMEEQKEEFKHSLEISKQQDLNSKKEIFLKMYEMTANNICAVISDKILPFAPYDSREIKLPYDNNTKPEVFLYKHIEKIKIIMDTLEQYKKDDKIHLYFENRRRSKLQLVKAYDAIPEIDLLVGDLINEARKVDTLEQRLRNSYKNHLKSASLENYIKLSALYNFNEYANLLKEKIEECFPDIVKS